MSSTPHPQGPGHSNEEEHSGDHHGHKVMKPTSRFDWENSENLYMQYVTELDNAKPGESGGALRTHNAAAYALWMKNKLFDNIPDDVKREMAQSHVTTMEAVTKPRQMGIADRNYKVGKVIWFDEVVLWKKPDGKGFNNWWDAMEGNNKSPAGAGHHLKEGVDYIVYRLPLEKTTTDLARDTELIDHYLQDVPTHSEQGVAYSQDRRKEIAQRFARDDMWEMASNTYAGYCAFRMNRGEVEKWASAFEPALLLDQKVGESEELSMMDDKDRYIDAARTRQRRIKRQLSGANLTKAKRNELLAELEDVEDYLLEMKYNDDSELRQVVGADWRKKTVMSGFTTFNAVGRRLLQRLLPGVAVALARSRRFQARAARIVGVELDKNGAITADSIHYGRLSECLEYQELLACAFLDRSGVEKLGLLPEIQKRLDAYRRYHGLKEIKLDLNIDMRGKKDKKDINKENQREREEEGIDTAPYDDGDDGGLSAEEAKEKAEEKKAKKEAQKKVKDDAAKAGQEEGPARSAAAPVSSAQEDYYKMQNEKEYSEHRTEFPPPDWKKSRQEWKLVDPDMKKSRWEGYFTRWGIDGLDPMLKMRNEEKWKRLWKKLGDAGRPTPEDLEE